MANVDILLDDRAIEMMAAAAAAGNPAALAALAQLDAAGIPALAAEADAPAPAAVNRGAKYAKVAASLVRPWPAGISGLARVRARSLDTTPASYIMLNTGHHVLVCSALRFRLLRRFVDDGVVPALTVAVQARAPRRRNRVCGATGGG